MREADHSHHLSELEAFFSDETICRDSFRLLVHFAIRLAAVSHAHEVLAIVERSAEPDLFQPLIGGLRLHLGEPINATGPARKLALQIAMKISSETHAHNEGLSPA